MTSPVSEATTFTTVSPLASSTENSRLRCTDWACSRNLLTASFRLRVLLLADDSLALCGKLLPLAGLLPAAALSAGRGLLVGADGVTRNPRDPLDLSLAGVGP